MVTGPERDVFGSLTEPDRQLIKLVCAGLTDGEIAGRIQQPESVVSQRLKDILDSIGAASRTQLVISAICYGM